MRVSLVNCQRVLSLSAGQRSVALTHCSPRHCLVSRTGNITVHINRSNRPDINSVIRGVAQWHVYQSCFQNVNERKQHLLDVWCGREHSWQYN